MCIAHWGHDCAACDFDFANSYGTIGTGFIHVHHLVSVAEIGKLYQVNPVDD